MKHDVFEKLGLPEKPVMLAPLAGVSDIPFRLISTMHGADLCYVEMLSAAALIYKSERTFNMAKRHKDEKVLGVQVTGRNPQETAEAVMILDSMNFDTIDLNMGCPVRKVVKQGCGSAILKDPKRVYDTVALCRKYTSKPFSAKIRLGWDHDQLNVKEVTQAVLDGGADWITIHGRCRSDRYEQPVLMDKIIEVAESYQIPVIANGNILTPADGHMVNSQEPLSGMMVSRGSLGNPWLFNQIKCPQTKEPGIDEWFSTVKKHLAWFAETYQDQPHLNVCMRKHLLWYTSGWVGAKELRNRINQLKELAAMMTALEEFVSSLKAKHDSHLRRFDLHKRPMSDFSWDPKYDMDRVLDRGVGDDKMDSLTT